MGWRRVAATIYHSSHARGGAVHLARGARACHPLGGRRRTARRDRLAPEEWFARTLDHLRLPENALHLWDAGIDVRIVPVALGVAFIVGDLLLGKRAVRPSPAIAREAAAATDTERSSTPDPPALPLPDRPFIAVLRFANLSGDPAQAYFSDGVADDIITDLSRDRALFVIARNSSFTYRGRSIDIKQVGRELGVRYVVEGSVRREAGRVRVTAQLIDAANASHVWADRYDRALEHVFAVQDEIAEAVANAIRPVVGDEEQRRVLRKAPGSLSAWEEYQRGLWSLAQGSAAATESARRCFQKSAEIDPRFAAAFAGLAFTYIREMVFHGAMGWNDAQALAESNARKAVALDPNDSEAHAALAHAILYRGDAAGAEHVARALTLNRNSAWAHTVQGGMMVFWFGRNKQGRDESLLSLRLDPRGRTAPMVTSALAASYYGECDYVAAVEAAQRCLLDYPDYAPPRRYLVAALGQLGRHAEAQVALQEFMRAAPMVFDAMVRQHPPYVSAAIQEHLVEGMRKAGWQG